MGIEPNHDRQTPFRHSVLIPSAFPLNMWNNHLMVHQGCLEQRTLLKLGIGHSLLTSHVIILNMDILGSNKKEQGLIEDKHAFHLTDPPKTEVNLDLKNQ